MAEGSEMRQLASSLVTELRAEIQRSSTMAQQPSQSSPAAVAVRQETSSSGKRTYRSPSLFNSLKNKKPKQEKLLTRDFMLLPPECRVGKESAVKFPRGAFRSRLSAARLIGKVQLRASMSENEVRKEICAAFAIPMGIPEANVDGCTCLFPFEFLQSSGQGSCTLCIPSVSQSFTWTGQEVASLSKQGRMIYLLAGKSIPGLQEKLQPPSSDEDDVEALPAVPLLRPRPPAATNYIEILDDYPSPSESSDSELQAAIEESKRLVSEQESVNVNAGDVLKEHRISLMNPENQCEFRLTVRRRHLFEDGIKGVKRLKDPSRPVRIMFVGEQAIDEGGPKREFFQLFLAELCNQGALFAGPLERRVLVHNAMALQKEVFLAAGKLIGCSLIHGGPGPQFFSPCTARYLLGAEAKELDLDDLADTTMSVLAKKIMKVDTKEEWASEITADDLEVLSSCGIPFARLEDKAAILEAMIKHVAIFNVKAELDQLREGMELFHLSAAFKRSPVAFLPLFIHSTKPHTAAFIQDLFLVLYSPKGSNTREKEESTIMHWISFLNDAEAGMLFEGADGSHTVTLEDILAFTTGARHVPPMGFSIRPTIEFREDQLPRASTCGNVLELPIMDSYDAFKAAMSFAIKNTVGFGSI